MIESVNNAIQNVAPGGDILFTSDIHSCCDNSVIHRAGSGIFTLRGTSNSYGRYERFWVQCGCNIAVPEGQTVTPIQISLAINGEAVPTSSAIVTPAAVGDYWNVNVFAYVNAPKACCYTVSIKNTSTIPIDVQNANIVVR